MANISTPNTFVPNTLIKSADVNANFSEIQTKYNAGAVQTDVAKTITVAHTWSIGQLWTALQTFTAGLAVSGSLTTLRNLVLSNDHVATDAITLTDTNAAPYASWKIGLGTGGGGDGIGFYNLTASLLRFQFAANGLFAAVALQVTAAVGKIIPGATSLSLRNNADNADNLLVTDVGDVTIRRDATITRNATVTGNLTVAGIVSGGVVAIVQPSDLTNTTVTPANTSLAVTLGASQTWKIDFDLMVSCNNVGGIVLNFAGPAGVTGAQMLIGPTSGATTFTTFTFGSFAASSTWSTYNSSANAVYLRGSCYVVTAGTGGAFTLQYAAGVAAQTAKVVAGSTLHATRIS